MIVDATRPRVAKWTPAEGGWRPQRQKGSMLRMKTIGPAVAVLLVLAPAALAFEPMPPIMQTLLVIFPEKNGWFVDEPLGVVPGTPEEAKPFFECFRVIVPDLESLDKAIGRLMANAPKLPIKKITRYDREPGAPGLAGFRGIWCKTEDESQVGFAIVTVNQNRFLLWAKQGYYPSFAIDSINAKVRDQYARDVSRYLAGIDAKVPDNEAPQAAGRMLPEWMDLYPPVDWRPVDTLNIGKLEEANTEIRAWRLHDISSFVPTEAGIERIIAAAPDTLWPDQDIGAIQHVFRQYRDAGILPERIYAVGRDGLPDDGDCSFAIDRYGRLRYTNRGGMSWSGRIPEKSYIGRPGLSRQSLLFPGAPVLSAGRFYASVGDETVHLVRVCVEGGSYFCSTTDGRAAFDAITLLSDKHLETLGHFFGVLKNLGIHIDRVSISKFGMSW